MQLQKKYGERDFAVLGVVSWNDEPVKMIETFVRRNGINYKILPHGARVASNWGVTALPTNYLIAPDGKVVRKIAEISPRTISEVESLIESSLN